MFVYFLFFICTIQAAQVDTISVWSNSMKKNVKNVVILPDNYTPGQQNKLPVVYLLNGHTGNHRSWIALKPQLPAIATEKQFIFVCPDGNNSWYWDSPVNPEYKYETYISEELIPYIDQHYASLADPKGRGITGLSMGGHGAMWLAIRHKDLFSVVGSSSGGVDIRPFPNNWGMKQLLGEEKDNQEIWDNHTVFTQLDSLKNGELAIIIDCGVDDFFYEVNKNVHNKLIELKIDHDFISRPGSHNAAYWVNAIDYQLLFMQKAFERNQK